VIAAGGATPRVLIEGVAFDNLDLEAALERTAGLIGSQEPSQLCFLNIDCLRQATLDPDYAAILRGATLVLPDGIGMRLAARVHGERIRADTNGSDFSPRLLRHAAAQGAPVFLLGSAEGVAARAAERLQRDIPGLRIAGVHSGFFEDDRAVVERINASGAQVLLVGTGVPRQEKWIAAHRPVLAPRLCAGVGALFSWLSGERRRAPAWVHRLHLEWAWRIGLEPRRMFERYILHDLPFLAGIALRRAFPAKRRP
jgi:exopolysaccharide biosynthesis WecB/TagA/CpsF family protein